MRVAVICAMDKELERLVKTSNAELVNPSLKIYRATISGNEVVCAVCGIGKVNSAMMAQRLIDAYSPEVIINCGIAGGLDKSLSVLDMVIAESAMYHDFHPLSLLEEDENIKTSVFECDKVLVSKAKEACSELCSEGKLDRFVVGRVVSGDCFVESDETSRRLRDELSGSCVEMEGAAIAQVCIVNGVKFLIMRCISDFADSSAQLSYDAFSTRASEEAVAVLTRLIEKL